MKMSRWCLVSSRVSLLSITLLTGFLVTMLIVPDFAVSALLSARAYHTATLLKNGKVLVTGGVSSSGVLSSAELYNSATDTFSPTGALKTPRSKHTATLLQDGTVLIAGGTGQNSAELYDPVTASFTLLGVMGDGSIDENKAVLLQSGDVLIQGNSTRALLYQPATRTFLSIDMADARLGDTSTLLKDGKVLIAGGKNGVNYLKTSQKYNPDPLPGILTSDGTMVADRENHAAVLLESGKVLLTGGWNGVDHLATAETYDPATSIFTATSAGMNYPRSEHTATLLPNESVLIIGGKDVLPIERYNPGTNAFVGDVSIGIARQAHTATMLTNAKVLIAGGINNGTYLDSSELYKLLPDLQSISVSGPAAANSGQAVTINATVKNQGAVYSAGCNVAVYLSTNAALDAGDYRLGYISLAGLAVGAQQAVSRSFVIPGTFASGNYTLIAKADEYGSVAESDETNNIVNSASQLAVTKVYPDLTAVAVSGPAAANSGQAVTVIATVRNQGALASANCNVAVYLSADAALDAGDYRLGNIALAGLAVGAQQAVSGTFVIPGTFASGNYTLIAKADEYGSVAESDETNNIVNSASQLAVTKAYPDLTAVAVSGPAAANSGQAVTVIATVRNQGALASANCNVAVYLSADAALDAGDYRLGNIALAGLAVGAQQAVSGTFVIPGTFASGNYTLIAKTDEYGSVAESDETNNIVNSASPVNVIKP